MTCNSFFLPCNSFFLSCNFFFLPCICIILFPTGILCGVGSVSSAGKDYLISDIRMNYDSAQRYCQSLGSSLADIPSTKREEVGTFIFTSKIGPTSVWASFEGLEPANDNNGSAFSANCETLATPGVFAKNSYLYALCERKLPV